MLARVVSGGQHLYATAGTSGRPPSVRIHAATNSAAAERRVKLTVDLSAGRRISKRSECSLFKANTARPHSASAVQDSLYPSPDAAPDKALDV